MLLGALGQLADQHDGHTSRVAGESELAIIVIYVTILVDFVEFEVVPLGLVDCLDVGVYQAFAILYQFVFEHEVDESMAELDFS